MTLSALFYRLSLPMRLRRHAAIRKARAEAAKRGQSTYWQRAGRKGREMFG